MVAIENITPALNLLTEWEIYFIKANKAYWRTTFWLRIPTHENALYSLLSKLERSWKVKSELFALRLGKVSPPPTNNRDTEKPAKQSSLKDCLHVAFLARYLAHFFVAFLASTGSNGGMKNTTKMQGMGLGTIMSEKCCVINLLIKRSKKRLV